MANPNSSSARGVTVSRIFSSTALGDLPQTGGVQVVNVGENLAGGPLDSLIMRLTITTGAAPCASDTSTLVQGVSVNFNGTRYHQFNAALTEITAENQPGQYGYFLNSIGGRFAEIPGSNTTREAYFRIPIGQALSAGTARMELTMTYNATAVAVASGQFEVFALYNSNMQTATFIPTSTSSTAMPAGQQQVVVRIPAKTGYVVSGIMVLNDGTAAAPNTAQDNLGANGIVNLSQGPYGLDADFLRLMNGDLSGEIPLYSTGTSLGFDGAGAATEQPQVIPAIQCAGSIFVPTFGLNTGSDVILLVDSAAAGSNRIFIPVLTAAASSTTETQPVQTAAVRTNTQKAILDRVDV